jgi:hypothetical protein
LDKPGCEASTVWKYLLQFHGWRMLLEGPKPPAPMDQTVIATATRQNACFVGSRPALFSSRGRTRPQHSQRHWRTDGGAVGVDGLGLQALELEVFQVGLVALIKISAGAALHAVAPHEILQNRWSEGAE